MPTTSVTLRIPSDLLQRIDSLADTEQRSRTSAIVRLLSSHPSLCIESLEEHGENKENSPGVPATRKPSTKRTAPHGINCRCWECI